MSTARTRVLSLMHGDREVGSAVVTEKLNESGETAGYISSINIVDEDVQAEVARGELDSLSFRAFPPVVGSTTDQ